MQGVPSAPPLPLEELRKETQGQPMGNWVEMSWSGSSLRQWDLGDRWTSALHLRPQLCACSNLHTGCVPEDPGRPCLACLGGDLMGAPSVNLGCRAWPEVLSETERCFAIVTGLDWEPALDSADQTHVECDSNGLT